MAGCVPHATKVAPATAPTVNVSLPVSREVTDYVDFTGRTQAKDAVNIEARATGYLIKISFKEGAEVNAGDLLFEIDPKPYQAQYNQALGQVNLYKAQLKLAQVTLDRDEKLAKINPGAIAALQLDTDKAAVDEADAQVKAAEASLDLVNQNLGYTKVYSPISGQVSRYYLTLGNLISQDQTVLTTVVSLDPMYAYVNVDEPRCCACGRPSTRDRSSPTAADRSLSSWDCRVKTVFHTRGKSTSSIIRSIQPRAPSWRAASSRIFCRPAAADCCCRACSCGSGCRSGSPIRPCWSSIVPSSRTRV